jgi:outer membrane protein
MKVMKFTWTAVAVLALSAAAFAQQGAAKKVAGINTSVFQSRIDEFKVKIDTLNRQFEPRVRELEQLAQRIQTLENTAKAQGITPAKVAELTEQTEALKREYQRKGEDLQADGNRAREQALQPISEKLERFARDYTARRGITLLVDIANAVQSGNLVWYDQRLDVTEDFIREYNKANPVTASAPAATPKPPQQ